MLEFEKVNKSYGDHDVIKDFSAALVRGEKICLTGRNGLGKTTLLKALLANGPGVEDTDVSIDSGTVKWGHEALIGYFAQDHTGAIPKGITVEQWLHSYDPEKTKEEIAHPRADALQGRRGREADRGSLRRRDRASALLQPMLQKPNILVLDEPTNHLDLEAINALNIALQKFEFVFLVVHDEDLLDEVGTRIWHFNADGITDHKGPYAEFLTATGATAGVRG